MVSRTYKKQKEEVVCINIEQQGQFLNMIFVKRYRQT